MLELTMKMDKLQEEIQGQRQTIDYLQNQVIVKLDTLLVHNGLMKVDEPEPTNTMRSQTMHYEKQIRLDTSLLPPAKKKVKKNSRRKLKSCLTKY